MLEIPFVSVKWKFHLWNHFLLKTLVVHTVLHLNGETNRKCLVLAFNFDEKSPILITNHFDHAESHFGASLVLLEMLDKKDSLSSPTGWILIGAPKANSSHPNHAEINEPGAIWRCSLGRPTLEMNDCTPVYMDPTGEYDPKNPKYAHKDLKDGGWLGGSMFVGESDRFVACASRYVNQKFKVKDGHDTQYLMNGMCYWTPKNYMMSDPVNETWPWLPAFGSYDSYRLFPLVNRTRQSLQVNSSVLFHDWSYGQAGFSLHLTCKNELLLGSPGIFDWTGAVIQYQDSDSPSPTHKRFNAGDAKEFSEVRVAENMQAHGGQFFEYFGYAVTSGHYFKRPGDNRTQIAAGAPRGGFLSGQVYIFSLGSDPSSKNGSVNSTIDSNSSSELPPGLLNLNLNDVSLDLLGNSPIMGPSDKDKDKDDSGNDPNPSGFYASYFGSVLTSVDIDADGLDELIVGAPLYSINIVDRPELLMESEDFPVQMDQGFPSDRSFFKPNSEEAQIQIYGDEGCVFVYGSSDGLSFDERPQELCGDKIPGSRFGSSISSIGDVNMDGFNDVAIGAPYEKEGRGAVYIYHGSARRELTFSQKLQAQDVSRNIRGFGYSLSLGVDIDGNSYPDLAVGCYLTNQVVIYRATPLVRMKGRLNTSLKELWADVPEFNVTSCVSYKGKSLPSILNFQVTLTLDSATRTRRFLEWAMANRTIKTEDSTTNFDPHSPAVRIVSLTKNVLTFVAPFQHLETCYNFTARKVRDIEGIAKPLEIRQEYHLETHDKNPGPTQLIHYEIYRDDNQRPSVRFNGSQTDFQSFYKKQPMMASGVLNVTHLLPISTYCHGPPPSSAAPSSSLQQLGQIAKLKQKMANDHHICVANLSLSMTFKSVQSGTGIIYKANTDDKYVLGSSDKLLMDITVLNTGEVANLPIFLNITWTTPHHQLRVNNHGNDCQKLSLKTDQLNLFGSQCKFKRPLKTDETGNVQIELTTKDLFVGEIDGPLEFTVSINSTSDLISQSQQIFRLPLDYKTEIVLNDFQEPREVMYSVNATTGTINLQHEFGVRLKGPSSVYELELEFQVPTEVKIDGKFRKLLEIKDVEGQSHNEKEKVRCHLLDVQKEILEDVGTVFGQIQSHSHIGTKTGSNLIPAKGFWPTSSAILQENVSLEDWHPESEDELERKNGETDDENKATKGTLHRNKNKIRNLSSRSNRLGDGKEAGSIVHCGSSEVKCVTVSCPPLRHFRGKDQDQASFLLQFRLYSETAKLYKKGAETFGLQSDARARVLHLSKSSLKIEKYDRFITIMKLPKGIEIPAWILIVAISTGLSLLTIIVFGLTKCGFFRRQQRESLQVLRKQTQLFERFNVDLQDERFFDQEFQRDIRFD